MNESVLATLNSEPLDRSRPLRDQLYALIRRLIITGKLKTEDPINENVIAERLGVSRTPVREAVKKLSDEGLIYVAAQSGTYVSQISREQVEEAYVIRAALEMEAIKRAAQQVTPEQIERLEDILDAHRRHLDRRQFAQAIAADDEFHKYTSSIIQMPMLWRAVDISKAQMDRCRHLSLPSPGRGETTLDEHEAILKAMKAHDPEAAAAAMRAHLATSLENALQLLDRSQAAEVEA